MIAINTIAAKTDAPISLSMTDHLNMERLVDGTSERFWNTAVRLMQRQIEFNTINKIAAVNLFDAIAAFIGQAVQAVFTAFNTAVTSKLSEVRNLIGDEPDISTIPVTGRVRFMTAGDVKVDPVFCQPLEDQEFDVDDPDIPQPPLHLHCRCRLVPV